jgi:hypothetical protein
MVVKSVVQPATAHARMLMDKIAVVYGESGDWVAIYKDGKLLDQKHSFEEAEVLRLVGVEIEVIDCADIEEGGFFPDKLEDVIR